MQPPFADTAISEKFAGYPESQRNRLLEIRAMIFDEHARLGDCGALSESLKWRQPSYRATGVKFGSPIRLDTSGKDRLDVSLYFICTTTLISEFRDQFNGELKFVGNREIKIADGEPLPETQLRMCIARALTYQRNRKAA